MPLKTKTIGACLLIFAGLVSSCDNGEMPNHNGIRPVTSVVTPIRYTPTAAQLHGATLESADVQKGWSPILPSLPVTPVQSGCLAELGTLPSPEGDTTVEYRDPENALPVLTERLASFQNNRAASIYQKLIRLLDSCTAVKLRVGGEKVSAKVAHSGPLDLGVENQAYVAVLASPGVSLRLDLDLFEDGAVVGCVAYTTPSEDALVVLTEYAKRAIGRLETLG